MSGLNWMLEGVGGGGGLEIRRGVGGAEVGEQSSLSLCSAMHNYSPTSETFLNIRNERDLN